MLPLKCSLERIVTPRSSFSRSFGHLVRRLSRLGKNALRQVIVVDAQGCQEILRSDQDGAIRTSYKWLNK